MPVAQEAVDGWAGRRDPEDRLRGASVLDLALRERAGALALAEAQLHVTGRL